jgi:hypothetical protein
VGSTSDSIAWAGSSVPWSIHICETSRTVSEVAQKKAGLSFQPICKALGTTTLSWFGGHDVCKIPALLPRHNLSPVSVGEIQLREVDVFSAGTVAVKSNKRGKTLPSSFTGTSGARRRVLSLTEAWMMSSPCRFCPLLLVFPLGPLRARTANDRSRIMRPRRFRCGSTTASGEIFNCFGHSF